MAMVPPIGEKIRRKALPTVGAGAGRAARAATSRREGQDYELTLIPGVAGDPFYVTMACGAQAEGTKRGVTLNITGGNKWDATVQKPVIDSVTAAKPDGVMAAPDDPKDLLSPLKAMSDAGLTVTFADTRLAATS